MSMSPNPQRGFIALTSAILIAAVLLIVCIQLSAQSFYTRSNLLTYSFQLESMRLAQQCTDYIRQQLSDDALYMGGEVVLGGACTISTSAGGDPRTFTLTTVHHHAYTTWRVTISLATLDVNERIDVP